MFIKPLHSLQYFLIAATFADGHNLTKYERPLWYYRVYLKNDSRLFLHLREG